MPFILAITTAFAAHWFVATLFVLAGLAGANLIWSHIIESPKLRALGLDYCGRGDGCKDDICVKGLATVVLQYIMVVAWPCVSLILLFGAYLSKNGSDKIG